MNVARIRREAALLQIPVAYTAQPGGTSRAQRGLLLDVWGPGMSADPADREIVPEVAPEPGDVVLPTYRYSAFHGSRLARVIEASGRDQVIVCGVYAHVGCLITACDAFANDLETFLVADAVADFSADEHRLALHYAARRCAVTLSTRQLLAHLAEGRPAQDHKGKETSPGLAGTVSAGHAYQGPQ